MGIKTYFLVMKSFFGNKYVFDNSRSFLVNGDKILNLCFVLGQYLTMYYPLASLEFAV